ncbi:hypothetical protein BBO99_00004207 [Phytophthora kernoviae]|uniref:Uncharacterized protein n=1 Tax=Phytophthora kernoviae TaxID=325452 RepID=A0A421ETJ1_9STRA|nr:hypothetical protein JM16_004178 [Phytophthora kernoviae]RLN02034.1 hypothetical protein BBI17_004381 [Phytophthora kernoviae]RLN80811.1 hypothetical protein BBO99_00004207 [Phytophthora kernoviae]
MTRNKRTLAAITATKRTKTRKAVKRAVDPDRTSLQDLLTLLHLQLVPFLTPHDLSRLLQICSHLLQSDVVDAVATAGLKGFYQQHGVHFGQKCIADWHQLVPEEAEGGIGSCVVCDTKPPSDLPVPRLGDKRMHLLAAVCLTHEGLGQVCDGVLQMPFGRYATLSYGSMQPVVFSLATALEEEDPEDELNLLTWGFISAPQDARDAVTTPGL